MPSVYTSDFALAYGECAVAAGKVGKYPLAIETGMNRIGVHYTQDVYKRQQWPRNFGRRGARAYVNRLARGAEAGRSGEALSLIHISFRYSVKEGFRLCRSEFAKTCGAEPALLSYFGKE